ncbi:hypothetical protein [Bradyrhizobium sp. 144]|uniref:hypothetical protein n=1 Tax=Bradyrhizobium sp. 144 TaxID=2782620 RepID=UPI001FFA7299|nr:hypothetical protein [Bradyrhizobium sp. 144]MCK1694250.1 hypothetical protein [Bradyrhizobium sp. 144]
MQILKTSGTVDIFILQTTGATTDADEPLESNKRISFWSVHRRECSLHRSVKRA